MNPARRRSGTARWRWKQGSPTNWCEIQLTGWWEQIPSGADTIQLETGRESSTLKGEQADKTWGEDFTNEHSHQVGASVGFEFEGIGASVDESVSETDTHTISTGGSSGTYSEMVDLARDSSVFTHITPKAELQTNNGVSLYTRMTQWRWVQKKRYGYISTTGSTRESTSKSVLGNPPITYTAWNVKKTWQMHGKVDAAAACIDQAPNCYPPTQCKDAACMKCHDASKRLSPQPYPAAKIKYCDDNQIAALGGFRINIGACPAENQRVRSQEECVTAASTKRVQYETVVNACFEGSTNVASKGCFLCNKSNGRKDLAYVAHGQRAESSGLVFLCRDHVNVEEEEELAEEANEEEELATLDCESDEVTQCETMCKGCQEQHEGCPDECVACEKWLPCLAEHEVELSDLLTEFLEEE